MTPEMTASSAERTALSPETTTPSLETPASGPQTTPDHGNSAPGQKPPARKPRPRLWFASAVAVILVLALTPPLLNVDRLRRRITASISASIGRPVHLDSVSLHLLPEPGFTLTNFVVSEDAAFGCEPTIRAMTVEATLRPSSLWRRQVEFSTIRFVEPSVNLVRNSQGHWNLQSLLMHAAQVKSAPTEQRKAGPAPRFPYIEATGARVNLKLGEEKQPFSLTDADFALWLPSPQQWRVRLKGKPARTDGNIGDGGTMQLEGSLQRAANMAAVPVDLTASWRDAPLGEASRLLTGEDAGWRGTLNMDAALSGKLGAATLTASVHLNDLRRADFIPARSLDLNIDCTGTLETTAAVVHDPECVLRSPRLNAIADTVDLTSLQTSGLRVGSPGVPEKWVLDWARLFSQRIPARESGSGLIAGSLVFTPANGGTEAVWQGEIHGDVAAGLPGFPPAPAGEAAGQEFSITSGPAGAVLAPLNLMPTGKPPLMLSGTLNQQGYTLQLQGTATALELSSLRNLFPPLTDGLEEALPQPGEPANKANKIDVTCTRVWGAAQTCAEAAITPVKKTRSRIRSRRSR